MIAVEIIFKFMDRRYDGGEYFGLFLPEISHQIVVESRNVHPYKLATSSDTPESPSFSLNCSRPPLPYGSIALCFHFFRAFLFLLVDPRLFRLSLPYSPSLEFPIASVFSFSSCFVFTLDTSILPSRQHGSVLDQ